MGLMTTPKPLIIIIWTCQEMMVWMSMELIGSMDVILSMGKFCFFVKDHAPCTTIFPDIQSCPSDAMEEAISL
jgi:hypothetical protein